MHLGKLAEFLKQKGDLLLRQIENPTLVEHESFTELLWAVIHLRDKLMSRKSLVNLSEADVEHLASDAIRVMMFSSDDLSPETQLPLFLPEYLSLHPLIYPSFLLTKLPTIGA